MYLINIIATLVNLSLKKKNQPIIYVKIARIFTNRHNNVLFVKEISIAKTWQKHIAENVITNYNFMI